MSVRLLPTSLMALAMATSAPAFAQAGEEPAAETPGSSRTTSYTADYFAQFAPRTALDIARRVPGFSLENSDNSVRGFAGAAGNVVINGARPSSKAEDLQAVLARIPASRVQKVEVGPGDLYGSDYSSKSQVLNFILTAEGGLDGNVTASVRRIAAGRYFPNLEGSLLYRRGSHSINLSAGTGFDDYVDEGVDRLFDGPTGDIFEKRRKVNFYRGHNPFLSLSYGFEPTKDKAIHLNARFAPTSFRLTQSNHVVPVGGTERDDRFVQDFDTPALEIGGDISRPVLGGTVKLVGLATRRKRDTSDINYNRIDGAVVGGFEQLTESNYDETLGRISWSRADLAGFAVEIGGELALNELDYSAALFKFDEFGNRSQVILPIDDATVREVRSETYVDVGRQLGKKLRVGARLAYERSDLKVDGDAEAERQLSFLKPSLTLDFDAGGGWRTQFILRRTVAQLDFYDFVSSAVLSDDRVNGGNADLVPQRAWEARLVAEHALLGTGRFRLQLGYDRISMLQDRILTEEGYDAPGNIGTGERHFLELSLDTPLGKLWPGLSVKSTLTLQRTRVEDPLNGEKRKFSGFWPEWNWYSELRRDMGRWSYGGAISDRQSFSFFRTVEIDSGKNGGAFATAFVEYRPDPRTSIRLDVDNAMNTKAFRTREFYDPDRSSPDVAFTEVRQRNTHPSFKFSIKRTFGGGGSDD